MHQPSLKHADGAPNEFGRICEAISNSLDRVPAELATRQGMALRFFPASPEQPLLWCFNNIAEAVLLSSKLGPRRPLLAMLSMHGLVDEPRDKFIFGRRLAELYTEQVPAATGGKICIGGNCQSAPLAEAIAHEIIGRRGQKPLLMLLEHTPRYCYPGSALLMFGSESPKYNPFLGPTDPVPRWKAQHGNCAWGIVPGKHGQYFIEPAVLHLRDYILQATAEFFDTGRIQDGAWKAAGLEAAAE